MATLGNMLALSFFVLPSVALGEAPQNTTPKPVARTVGAPEAAKTYYAVTLSTSSVPVSTRKASAEFPNQVVYLARVTENGKELFFIRAGFFTSPAEAAVFRNKARSLYPDASITRVPETEYQAIPGAAKSAPAAKTTTPAIAPKAPDAAIVTVPVAPPLPNSTATPATATAGGNVEDRANTLMGQGRDALAKGNNIQAIRAFDQLLRLPPNRFSQDAQEFIGLAHERNGEIAAAKVEYTLYLKQYPQGEGADRVRQRLANLETTKQSVPEMKEVRKKEEPSQRIVYGSLSQYYYHGASQIETTTTGTAEKATLSLTDQSALVTNLDLGERFRSQQYDNRVVFRDTHTKNFLPNQEDRNRVNAAYFEIKDRQADYTVRTGRQPGNSGGVLGRFDGVLFGYGLAPQWRLNAVAGTPVEIGMASKKKFSGLNVDMGTFAEHWGGSAYVIHQTVDGVPDRQAVGGEVRYFDPKLSFYSLFDYDTLFHELNTFLFQTNWQSASSTTYNLLLDRRMSPTLQTSNALIGQPLPTVEELRKTMSEEQIRRQAKALTPITDLFMIGATHPFNGKWQLGGDIRLSRTSSTEGAGAQPATENSGSTITYSLQAIGTGILLPRDIAVFNFSHINSKTFNGQSFGVSNRSILRDKWTLEPSLRYYQQEDNLKTKLTRVSPTIKLGYKWKESVTLEVEAGMEKTETRSSTQVEDSTRTFYSLGYRWDF